MWNIKITTVWFPDKLNFVSSEYKISSPPLLKSSKDNWRESKHNPVNHIRRDDGACGQAAESTPTYICCWRNGTKAHAGVHCWADLNMVGSVVSWSYWAHCLTELSCWRTPPPLICMSVYMCLCIKLFFFFLSLTDGLRSSQRRQQGEALGALHTYISAFEHLRSVEHLCI